MSRTGNPILKAVNRVIDRAPVGSESKLRLQHYTMLLFLGLPTMSVFAVVLGLRGEYLLSAMILVSVTGLTTGWFLLERGTRPAMVYRANSTFFATLLIFMVAIGGEGGSKILWTYTFPLIAFFLMGKREGAIWVALVYVFSALFVLGRVPGVDSYDYPPAFQLRFLVTLGTVSAIAAGFEHFRDIYRQGLLAETDKLQAALDDVKALSGLLPICAHCKNIRDDQGYWNKLESYLHVHSEVRFSHGICPDCLNEHYPEMGTNPPVEKPDD